MSDLHSTSLIRPGGHRVSDTCHTKLVRLCCTDIVGSLPLELVVSSLQMLSQTDIGLNNILLACVIGHACSSASEDVKYDVWAPAAAAMLYSMLEPAKASVRLAAAEEFKDRGESEKKRSANLQALQAGPSAHSMLLPCGCLIYRDCNSMVCHQEMWHLAVSLFVALAVLQVDKSSHMHSIVLALDCALVNSRACLQITDAQACFSQDFLHTL